MAYRKIKLQKRRVIKESMNAKKHKKMGLSIYTKLSSELKKIENLRPFDL